jgi:hypothetical protein
MTPSELLEREQLFAASPDDFPMRPPGISIEEYWKLWTEDRLAYWREGR